jgi:hypothetical protein
MKIVALASEPFNEIISYLDTHEWIALWICGDLRMNWRLGKGKAVRKMEVVWSQTKQGRWPFQAIELDGLESFSFCRYENGPLLTLSSLYLALLNRNLKKLELKCGSSLDAFSELMMTSYNHFPHLEVLSLSGFTASSQFEMLSGCIPSNLKELKIHGNQVSYGTLSLSSLPKSLTKMDCNLDELKVTPESDCRFPESLKTLTLNKLSIEALHLLPLDIEHLKIARVGRGLEVMTIEDWKAVGRLTKLEFLYLGYFGFLEVKFAETLPRSLKTLTFSGIFPMNEALCIDMLRALPPSLTHLRGPMREVTKMIAQNLPRTLQELGLDSEYVSLLSVASLPDSLTQLSVRGLAEEFEQLKHLPASLRSITLYANHLPKKLLSLLPRCQIQSFHLIGDIELSREFIEMFPRSLTTLDMPHGKPQEEIFGALPPSLTKLSLGPSSLSWKPSSSSSQLLPRTLTHLSVQFLVENGSEDPEKEWISGLPSSLTYLRILLQSLPPSAFESFGKLSNLESLQVEVQSEQREGWAKLFTFSSLPRRLTHLKIRERYLKLHGHSDCGIDSKTFKGAPPSLTELCIPKSKVTAKDLYVFPYLRSCTFSNATFPED